MAIYDYRIAAGHNNTAGLVNVEDIAPPGDRAFYPPSAYSSYNVGAIRLRLDGTAYTAGMPSVEWLFDVMTRAQWRYLQDTYTVGGNSHSGKVTVRTRDMDGAYTNYNAVMILPRLVDLERSFTLYRRVIVRFIRLEAVA
jgi:hypothetical protein